MRPELSVFIILFSVIAAGEDSAPSKIENPSDELAWNQFAEVIHRNIEKPTALTEAAVKLFVAQQLHNQRVKLTETLSNLPENESEESSSLKARIHQLGIEEYSLVFSGRGMAALRSIELHGKILNHKRALEGENLSGSERANLEDELEDLEAQKVFFDTIRTNQSTVEQSAQELLEDMPGLFGDDNRGLEDFLSSAEEHFRLKKPSFKDRIIFSKFKQSTGIPGDTYYGRLITAQFLPVPGKIRPVSPLGEVLASLGTLKQALNSRKATSEGGEKTNTH